MSCELVIPKSDKCVRCKRCISYRGSLRVQSSRLKNKSSERTEPSSCTPYNTLTSEEMTVRMKKLHDELRRIKKQRDRMKERLTSLVEKHGVTVDEQVHGDLTAIIESEGRKAMERANCTSFQRVFWQQQALAASKKDPRGMRWHPLMVKWCIYLRYMSQGARLFECSTVVKSRQFWTNSNTYYS